MWFAALLTPAVVELVPSTLISGTFTLSIMNYTTAPINFNAAPAEVEAKLAMIGTGPVTVTQIGPDHVNGYTWLVTFTSTYYNYDVPLMM